MQRIRRIWTAGLLAGLSLATGAAGAAAEVPLIVPEASILLRSGVIDVRRPPMLEEAVAEPLRAGEPDGAGEVVLVKFPGPVTAEQERALRETGARIFAYLPFDAYLVRLPAEGLDLAEIGASWSGPYHPAYKLSPAVAALEPDGASGKAGKAAGELRQVMVQVYPDADLGAVVDAIRSLGLEAVAGAGRNPFFSRVRLLLTSEEIAAHRDGLARLRDVFWIDLEGRRTLFNDDSVWVGQSGTSGDGSLPIFDRGIFGQGQIVAVLDTGIDPDACWFRDDGPGMPPVNACNGGTAVDLGRRKVIAADFLDPAECSGGIANHEWDNQGHGSHVAGTAAGDNPARPLLRDPADGMAPGARLVIQDGGFGTDNCGDLPGIGCPVVDLNPIFQQAYDQGARIHTNSWGDNENAAVQNNYTAASQDADEFMWSHKDFLILFAVGNSGPDVGSASSPGTAKSVVAVGATLPGGEADFMAAFSSCGPTDDGRLKPEVTVPGQSIVSAASDSNAASNNCGTRSTSGTSMAAPGAAGLAALIRQYYTGGWYPSGGARPADGFTPSAALLKATLVHAAVGMPGALPVPDPCQGWGRVQLDRALAFAGQSRRLWVRDDGAGFTAAGQEHSQTFEVAAGEPLAVTLAWTDYPSTPAAAIHLVNDLDLTVTGPGGAIWRGNVFAGGASSPGGTADRRNPLERVLLASPAAGTYTVTVRAFNVPRGPQPFAVVVTGALAAGASTGAGKTVYADDFEAQRGWAVNPSRNDTARPGAWERGDPQATRAGGPKQLGTTVNGSRALVTGRRAGPRADAFDLDGGVTSIQSPPIRLPATGRLRLSFSYYLAHGEDSSPDDFLRVRVIAGGAATTVLEERGAADNDDAVWATTTADLTPWAGRTVRLRVEAADADAPSLVEAAVDDVRVVQLPD